MNKKRLVISTLALFCLGFSLLCGCSREIHDTVKTTESKSTYALNQIVYEKNLSIRPRPAPGNGLRGYQYYIETAYDDSSAYTYFEKNQYNLDENGFIVSSIHKIGNTIEEDDLVLYECDDISDYAHAPGSEYHLYTYDADGKLIEELVYDAFDSKTNPAYTYYYSYLPENRVLRQKQYYGSNTRHDDKIIYLDARGNMILEYHSVFDYSCADNGTSEIMHLKDTAYYFSVEKGKIRKKESVQWNGYVSYDYDNKGNLVSETTHYENQDAYVVMQYAYDENGRITDYYNKAGNTNVHFAYYR